MTTKPNFSIIFKQKESSVIIADNIPNIEDSVAFALSLHKASNNEHIIYVMQGDMIQITFNMCVSDPHLCGVKLD